MRQILLFLALLLPFCAFSQFKESFSGSSVTSTHPWQGTINLDTDLCFINASGQLQINTLKGRSGTAVVAVPVPMREKMTWDIDVKLDFKSTSQNNLKIHTYSDNYFDVYVQAGTNKGQVSLYLDNGGKSPVLKIKGREGLLTQEPYAPISIRLTLEEGYIWTLYTRREGEDSFVKEGSAHIILDLANSSLFSLSFKYVQARESTYYIDNIAINYSEEGEPEPGNDTEVQLINIEQPRPDELLFFFDKPVDISDAACFIDEINGEIGITYGQNKSVVHLLLPESLAEENSYYLSLENLWDMQGKPISDITLELYFESEEVEEPEEPEKPEEPISPVDPIAPGEIIFNELLPNPFAGGSEYIELYNRSNRSLYIDELAVAVRKSDGSLGTEYPLSAIKGAVKKEGYILLSKDIEGVSAWYSIYQPDALYEIKLPVLANTSSSLVLYRIKDQIIIDEVSYSSKWHASSVKDQKGVALERIDPNGDTQDSRNWMSAASLSGFGTPGYKNSQFGNKENENGVNVETPVRREDGMYTISYHLDNSGYSCRAYIYNMNGYRVAEVANNDLVGISGQLIWNGKTSDGSYLKIGIYILYVEFYRINGEKLQLKKAFLVR